ncbi:MAG: hypothetical protein ACJ760_11365 [Thermoleophilaceae bacterium]
MTGSRRILIALPIALVLAAGAALAANALRAPERPIKPAYVTSQGLRARAAVGSYCVVGKGAGGCGDAAYPLHPRGHLPITPGSRLRVNLRRHAAHLEASLVRVDGDHFDTAGGKVKAGRAGGNGRFWRLKLPDDLGGADILSLEATLKPSGDANWWAGVKPVERWP